MPKRTLASFAFVLAFTFTVSVAEADPAAAEALFREARELLGRGELDAACEKFEASNALEPSSGTLLNLASCRLKQGRTATAWAYFISAARMARTQNRPAQEKEAKQRASELESQLSYVTVRVTEPVPGLVIRRDGKPLEPAAIGTRVPHDPGRVLFEVSAPGYRPVQLEVTVQPEGDQRTISVPPLVPEAGSSAGTAVTDEPPPSDEPARGGPGAGPWVLGGAGVAAIVAGGVFGALAMSSNSEAERLCENRTTSCPPDSIEAAERRDRQALFATVGVGVGIAAVGAAGLWWLGSSGTKAETALDVRAHAAFGRDTAIVRVSGAF